MTPAIWWIRRDLRLTDNPALTAALEHGSEVVPLFILDPGLLHSANVGPKRLAFLFASLRSLHEDLQARGSGLLVREGRPRAVLSDVKAESGAGAIFAEADHSPYARRRDRAVAASLPLQHVTGLTVHPPEAVHKTDGDPYVVFTPYSRAWKALPLPGPASLLPPPDRIPSPKGLAGEPLPTRPQLPETVPFPPGEAEAQRRLAAFCQGDDPPIFRYADRRNRLDLDGTSQLSPYLRFGMLSARQAVVAARSALEAAPGEKARKGAETWLNELIWREFYIAILYQFPHVAGKAMRPQYEDIPWENDRDLFAAWCEGRTGYPVVDAAMRQLAGSGWMHNRARMIVASFLVKDLLVDWRWGERWFMQHLVDGDLAANNGGWQWSAGTGADAAPYFRIFNPSSQAGQHDPEGTYIRRWVPELANVPDAHLRQPWTMPAELQRSSGCLIGEDYPAPIVDHKAARERALLTYGAATSG